LGYVPYGDTPYNGGAKMIIGWGLDSSSYDSSVDFGNYANMGRNNSDLYFVTNDNGSPGFVERMRITSSGYVGIGTTAPSKKVEIANGGSADNNLFLSGNAPSLWLAPVTGSDPNPGYGVQSVGALVGLSTEDGDYGGQKGDFSFNVLSGDTSSNSAIRFNITAPGETNGGLYTERMRIQRNGNVGIGTSSPQVQLHVAGKGRFDDTVHIEERGDLSMGEFTYDPEPLQEQQAMSQGLEVGGATVMRSSGGSSVVSGTSSGRPTLSGTSNLR
jgi:hypothetical protein